MKRKKEDLACGYVRPYEAQSRWVLAAIPFVGIGAMLCYLLYEIPELDPTVVAVFAAALALCPLFLLIVLRYDKSAVRYRMTKEAVYSRNLWHRHCVLPDGAVEQIELCMSVGDVNRYSLQAKAPHLVCSDRFYRHDPNISRSYHREHQVVVRITPKNFPAVQKYLDRMGLSSGAVDFDMLVQVLQCDHDVYRRDGKGWKKHFE